MAATKLSTADKKDLDRYTKFLALKFTQIIVQSRLGEKASTLCRGRGESASADWFSLAVEDEPSVAAEARRWLSPEGRARLPLRVDTSLRTAEGEELALESWRLSGAAEPSSEPPPDPQARVLAAVYNRMGKLLKSLLCVTRAVPAYRLSRRQCPQSYSLFYRVTAGEAAREAPAALGEGHRALRVGQLATPSGCLQLTVSFRTRMTIAPSPHVQRLLLDSHHFLAPPGASAPPPEAVAGGRERRRVDLDKPMRAGAFVDVSRIRQFKESDFPLPEEPPFSWILEAAQAPPQEGQVPPSPAPAPTWTLGEDGEREGVVGSSGPGPAEGEDRLMEELHFPFASAEKCPIAKLAGFYRQCWHAPPLQSFQETPEADLPLERQLELFESSSQEYEQLLAQLCTSPNNN